MNYSIEKARSSSKDAQQLILWMEQVKSALQAIIQSRRWKMGNTTGKVLNALVFRSKNPMAVDHMQEIFIAYENWKKKSAGRYSSLLSDADIRQLTSWLGKLKISFEAMMESRRWRLGLVLGGAIDMVLLRKKRPLATDYMRKIFDQFEYKRYAVNRVEYKRYTVNREPAQAVWSYNVNEAELLRRVRQYNAQKCNRKAKVVVYTAIIGGYDPLILPETIINEWDYVVFSDQEIPGEHIFEVRRPDYYNDDPVRIARYLKMHPHIYFPEHEYAIWIDSSMLVRGTHLSVSVEDCSQRNVLIMFNPHPHRSCVYDEQEACIQRGKDEQVVIEKQIDRYRVEGLPESLGLFETGILIRKHNNEQVKAFNEAWWKEINTGSRRDQLSVMYVLWKQKLMYEILPGMKDVRDHEDNDYCLFLHGGKKNSKIPIYRQPFFMRIQEQQPAFNDAKIEEQIRTSEQPMFHPDDLKPLEGEWIDIIVCVHNAIDDVRKCIASVLNTMLPTHRLILVDDGSGAETRKFLRGIAGKYESVKLLRNNVAKGYTRAANAGIRVADAPFMILLNSDTIVSDNWTLKLLQAARSSQKIGIVGPMSNAASWQSLPLVQDPINGGLAVNELPPGKSVADMDKLCEKYGWFGQFPHIPLVNGFCFGIKREVIKTVGYLDDKAFPMGYGEEDDFSQRALDAGFVHTIATHCYVFHAKSKSFGSDARKKLAEEGGSVLRSRYGEERIQCAVQTMRNNPLLQCVRRDVSAACGIENPK